MKYLKTYEANKYKKFLIIRASNSLGFLLIKITNSDSKSVAFRILYKYYKGEIKEARKRGNLYYGVIDKRILFQYDNLDDALENLKMIGDSQKYNL